MIYFFHGWGIDERITVFMFEEKIICVETEFERDEKRGRRRCNRRKKPYV